MATLKVLARPLFLGLVIRELLAPWTGHPFDFEIWTRLGVFMQSGASPYSLLPFVNGISFAPYPVMTSISYPPLSAFIFAGTYAFYQMLGHPSAFLYYFLLKQPMVISDLLVAVVLYRMISLRGDAAKAKLAATIWVFFPFSIIVSSMWGALDPFALLLILASVYAYHSGRPTTSAALLGLSIYLKLMPIIFLPLFLLRPSPLPKKAWYAAVSLAIPLAGTLVPIYALGWGFSGITAAVSYQGDLPGFGGMGVFNFLSLWVPPSGLVTQILGWMWLPALLVAYAYSYFKKLELIDSLLIGVLLFSLFRPVLPEQWALYPLCFLLLSERVRSRVQFWGIAAVATTYLLVNNFLLVRFYSPLTNWAFNWDQYVTSASAIAEFRYALLLVLSTLFVAESLSVIARKDSLLHLKLSAIKSISRKEVGVAIGYVAVVSLAGGVLDFTATKMVTDWALAIQSRVFLGLSWLSLYHIMLVAVFEITVVLVVLFSGRNLSDSISLFFTLTFLNFIASGLSLVLYRSLEGAPLLASTAIYLVGSSAVTERAFVVFSSTLGVLGFIYLREIRTALLVLLRRGNVIVGTRLEGAHAPGLSPAS